MSESNDIIDGKSVKLQCESNKTNETSLERRLNRSWSRYNPSKSLISPQNENRSTSLSDDKSLNNNQDLLMRWINNATNEIKSPMILVQVKQSESNQEMIEQMQNELENIKQKFCEFSHLFQTWQMLTERKFQEIIELSEKHENEIDNLKMLYQKNLDNLQQQLDQLRSNSVKITNKETKLLSKTRTIFKRKSLKEKREKFEGVQTNLMSDTKLLTLNQVPSLSWEITGINHKLQTRQEIWSKYFQTQDKKFTMRFWIHFHGIPNKSSMNIELLVWKNSQSVFDQFIYEEDITIIISNKMMPYCFESISKRIRIDETIYSSVINVKYSNLNKNNVLKGDSINIKCMIGNK